MYRLGEVFHNTERLRVWIALFIILTMVETIIWDLLIMPLTVYLLIVMRLSLLFSSKLKGEISTMKEEEKISPTK